MSELVLPQTIDAGTEIVASELQSNFVATRDIINGQLEGGSGSSGNIKADGITARELANSLLTYGLPSADYREGVDDWEHMLITPGAGLVLNYAAGTAWVRDDSGVLATGALLPVTVAGSTVTVPANASGNPRLDQIILTVNGYGTGTVSVLQGTPNAATTIDNRTGAAALPNDAIRLADALTTNGFAGPYVNHTSLRNRMAWAHPIKRVLSAAGAYDIIVDGLNDQYMTMEFNVLAAAFGDFRLQPNGDTAVRYYQMFDGGTLATTPASAAELQGAVALNNNGIYLAYVGGAAGSGSTLWAGRAIVGIRPDTAAGSAVTNSHMTSASGGFVANHAVAERHIASRTRFDIATAFTYIHYFNQNALTITGTIVYDRIPFTTTPV